MQVREIGEFGLIDRISRFLPSRPPDVVVGIGDDVAVLRTSGPEYLLATCDIQVEGVHFIREAIGPYRLGRKAVAINVSDVAAMGGTPSWVLVSLAVPDSTDLGFIEELYRGMSEQAALAGAAIVGGNVSRLDSGVVIDITLLGQIAPEHLILRSGARPGDSILVTGHPGESRAGLELARGPGLPVSEAVRKRVEERHFTPQPRLREGRLLARSGLVRAMIDISDGLMADLGHLCDASQTGAQLRAGLIPVSEAASEVASAAGANVLDWVLSGGEDYELLFAARPGDVPRIRKMLREQTSVACHELGIMTGRAGEMRLDFENGKQMVLPPGGGRGWDHFSEK